MTLQQWRLIDTGLNDGYTNMAIDHAIMDNVRAGYVPPTLRFYQWDPKALTVGYFQNIYKELDLAKCGQLGIDVTRRLTGGRAVLHHLELTYSIVCTHESPVAVGSIIESYLRISRGIVAGLKQLGIDVQIVAQPRKIREGSSAACFDTPSWYELVVDKKKLVGSAQTRRRGVLLQHGSIPFSLSTDLLATVLRFNSEASRESFSKMLKEKAIGLDQCIANLTKEKLITAIAEGLGKELKLDLAQSFLTETEVKSTHMYREKYASNEWILKSGRSR